jgi:hypothetical protein
MAGKAQRNAMKAVRERCNLRTGRRQLKNLCIQFEARKVPRINNFKR